MPIPLGAEEVFSNTGRPVVALSPDGSHIVYAADLGLSLRPVDQLLATPLAGARETSGPGQPGARNPFFSADGQWIGYHAGGQLKKISITGGAPVTLCDLTNVWGASWGADDTILLGQGPDGIWQVPGTSGTPTQLIAVEEGELAHGPQMLPGGEWVLFTLRPNGTSAWGAAQIVEQSVVTGERHVLIDGGRDGRYVATGHLVYVVYGVLFAVPFDLGARAVTGGPVPLVEGIREATGGRTGAAHFSVARNGSLVYVPSTAGVGEQLELVWVNRAGEIEPVGAERRAYRWGRVSPDGTRLAVEVRGDNPDVWIYDLARETLTRLTFDSGDDAFPLWTPDSSRVVFTSDRERGGLFWKAADGTGEVERLLENRGTPRPYGWSADGRLVFELDDSGDIGVLTLEGDRTMELVLDTEAVEGEPAISPDGRWIAHTSNESGVNQVYVRPFPNIDEGKWQVSSGGGSDPMWSPDGGELFFLVPEGMMAGRVQTEPTFNTETPVRLFDGTGLPNATGRSYDIAPDGERFLFQAIQGTQAADGGTGLVFVLNWHQELLERVPIP